MAIRASVQQCQKAQKIYFAALLETRDQYLVIRRLLPKLMSDGQITKFRQVVLDISSMRILGLQTLVDPVVSDLLRLADAVERGEASRGEIAVTADSLLKILTPKLISSIDALVT